MQNTFVKIPIKYIFNKTDKKIELLLYRCLKFLNYSKLDSTRTSIAELVTMCKCSLKAKNSDRNPMGQIRSCLQDFLDKGYIQWNNSQLPDSANTLLKVNKFFGLDFKLNREVFDPPDKFVILYDGEWDKIMSTPTRTSYVHLLRTFLYIKYWQSDDIVTNTYLGCYKTEQAMASDLGFTITQLNNYLAILIEQELLSKRITGSYKTLNEVRNAPNIYTLVSDEKRNRRVSDTLQLLKTTYGVGDEGFMPIVYKDKCIRKDSQNYNE